MKMLLAFGATVLGAAAGLAYLDQTDVLDRPRTVVTASAVTIDTDPPPHNLLCNEATAELRIAAGGPTSDFLDDFFLVTDPRETCRDDTIAERGGFADKRGRCYTLREIGTGQPDLPMVCSERIRQDGAGQSLVEMQCSGWNRKIETDDDGAFRLVLERPSGNGFARVSEGRCAPL